MKLEMVLNLRMSKLWPTMIKWLASLCGPCFDEDEYDISFVIFERSFRLRHRNGFDI